MLHKKALWSGLTYVFALLLCICVTVAIILEQFSSNIDDFFGTQSSVLVSDEGDDSLYSAYTPDAKYLNKDGTGNSNAIIKAAMDLGEQEAAEGTVLLKNNGVLPLNASTAGHKPAVTLLGVRSHKPILGAGMGVKVQGPLITLEDALQRTTTDWGTRDKWDTGKLGSKMDEFTFTGAGYSLNQDAISYYTSFIKSCGNTYSYTDTVSSNIMEPSQADLQSSLGTCSGYTDAVIVVLGRGGGESKDYLPGSVTAGLGNTEPLELTTNEKGTIEYAKSVTGNSGKVIILINSCNALELDAYKDDAGIGAILNISYPGAYGMLGVADVLCGTTSPSGALADIEAADALSAPAMQNMGDYTFSNAGTDITRINSYNYVMEAENIYTGYRYYETRYEDTVLNASATKASGNYGVYNSGGKSWKYSDEVTYGFGYGLSYTTFSQEIQTKDVKVNDNRADHSIMIDIPVKVTNTGKTYSGKSIVEIYGQAPYTYGGIEKTSIELLGYGKTATLAPGASETVTVTADLQNIASYDSSANEGKGGYIMDEGSYYFAVGNGAHDALNSIILAKNGTAKIESEDIDRTGADLSSLVYTYSYKVADGTVDQTTFSTSKSGGKIENQLPYADFNHYQDNAVKYLTRSDWSTFPTEYRDIAAPASMLADLNGTGGFYYTTQTGQDTSGYKWGQDYGEENCMFYQMSGASWDDENWDKLLSQLTLNESMYLAAFGGPTFPAAESIGMSEIQITENNGNGIVFTFAGSKDTSSPWAIDTEADSTNSGWNGQVFGGNPLLAATFNPEIALRIGEFLGNESLFLGISIIWGPGLNTHRDAYNGRNCEYYSEDPVLCGVVAEYFSYGCAEYGLIAAPKHFAFNDQETNRQGVAPFMTEQRAREVELRAYQIPIECPDMAKIAALAAVQEGPNYESMSNYEGMYGLMTSFSKIGAVECTCSRGLLTGILKNEWGFHGYAVTDITDDIDLYTSCVYAGITGYDIRGAQGFDTTSSLSSTTQFANGSQVNDSTLNADTYSGDAVMMQALKDNNRDLLWSLAQSNLMNRYGASTHVVSQMTWWRALYISAIVIFAVLTAAGAALYVTSIVLKKREAK